MDWIIEDVKDLHKLKELEKQGIKINRSAIARKLQIDRRTVEKYIDGYQKKTQTDKPSKFDCYYPFIKEVLEDSSIKLTHKSELYTYLVKTIQMEGSESNFRKYIREKDEFNKYFNGKKGNEKDEKENND